MRPSYRVGIWSRLLMAFSFISGITVLVGIIALLIFDSSERVVEQLAEEHIPELVQVSDFVKLGGQIVAVAPSILSTDDENTRESVRRDLDGLVNRLKQRLQSLTVARPALHTSLESLVKRLETNLTALQLSVNRQSELQHRLNRMTERLRWLYIDLIGEIDPLKQDYTYDLEAEIERVLDAAREGRTQISADELQASRVAKESVEKVRSDGVLLVSLMVQGASLETMSQLDNFSALSADAVAALRQDMARLKDDVGALSLRSVLEDIYQLAEGDDSVFSVRRTLLASDIRGREILKQNQLHVAELESAINDIVIHAEKVAGRATSSTRLNLRRAKTSMILMVLISLVTVVAVMWFYVRGNIVARLSALSTSMRAIARGDLDHRVPKGGSDEIGRMAVALRVFRDTAQAVREKTDHLRRINVELREEVKQRRRIENELVQTGKLAALGQFSASIAHELNQPLSAIRYYLPLKRRLEDLPLLLNFFLGQMAERFDRPEPMVSTELWQRLTSYHWPGNVRELRNVAQQLVLGLELDLADKDGREKGMALALGFDELVQRYEKRIIERCEGRVEKTAQLLKMPRKRLYLRMQKLAISKDL